MARAPGNKREISADKIRQPSEEDSRKHQAGNPGFAGFPAVCSVRARMPDDGGVRAKIAETPLWTGILKRIIIRSKEL